MFLFCFCKILETYALILKGSARLYVFSGNMVPRQFTKRKLKIDRLSEFDRELNALRDGHINLVQDDGRPCG